MKWSFVVAQCNKPDEVCKIWARQVLQEKFENLKYNIKISMEIKVFSCNYQVCFKLKNQELGQN